MPLTLTVSYDPHSLQGQGHLFCRKSHDPEKSRGLFKFTQLSRAELSLNGLRSLPDLSLVTAPKTCLSLRILRWDPPSLEAGSGETAGPRPQHSWTGKWTHSSSWPSGDHHSLSLDQTNLVPHPWSLVVSGGSVKKAATKISGNKTNSDYEVCVQPPISLRQSCGTPIIQMRKQAQHR